MKTTCYLVGRINILWEELDFVSEGVYCEEICGWGEGWANLQLVVVTNPTTCPSSENTHDSIPPKKTEFFTSEQIKVVNMTA